MDYRPLLGVISLGDPREEVPWRREEEERHRRLIDYLQGLSDVKVSASNGVIRGLKEARDTVEKLVFEGCDVLLLYIPIWTYPSITVMASKAATDMGVPLVIVYNDGVLSGLLASVGALKQVSIEHRMIYGRIEKVSERILCIARACMAIKRLRGSVYGVFGGRALGMYTVVDDSIRWQRVFGIDIEHVDQAEILREAEKINEELVKKYLKWIEESVGLVEYDGNILTREKLKRQIRVYLALKKLVRKYRFDFCGLKCQPELSDYYVDACLAIALLNDPYDMDGDKEPIVCACEVDHDGALTMQILKLISGGKPTTLMDVLVYDEEEELLYLGNCGGMSTWFAKRSKRASENLREVHLRPQIQGKAGGAATQYVADEGSFTIARLYRVGDNYNMVILKAKSVRVPRESLRKSMWPWPHIVVKIDKNCFNKLIKNLGANHLHAVHGDYVNELQEFCELMNIQYTIIKA